MKFKIQLNVWLKRLNVSSSGAMCFGFSVWIMSKRSWYKYTHTDTDKTVHNSNILRFVSLFNENQKRLPNLFNCIPNQIRIHRPTIYMIWFELAFMVFMHYVWSQASAISHMRASMHSTLVYSLIENAHWACAAIFIFETFNLNSHCLSLCTIYWSIERWTLMPLPL